MGKDTYTVLIWNEIPDDTVYFVIPNDVADQYRHFLEEANNKILNKDEADGLYFLDAAVWNEQDYDLEHNFEKYRGIFMKYECKETPLIGNFTHIYVSGVEICC